MDYKTKLLCLNTHNLTTAELYPYIAYINGEGTPKDILFNTLVLDYSQTECRINQWENVIYSLFRNGENLRALESAAGDIKAYLGLSKDFRWDIYISAPIPVKSREYFGDINGNGITEKLLTNEDCARAFSWFADNLIRRFKACGFANINLAGWYLQQQDQNLASVITAKGYNCIFSDNCDVVTETEEKSILSSAVSENQIQRKLYDNLYGDIQQIAATPMPIVNEPVEEVPEFADPVIEEALTKPEVITNPEVITQPEIESASEETTQPERERVTVRKECIAEPGDNLKSIVLDIDISTGAPCPPPCQMTPPPMPPQQPKKCDDYKKKFAFGAGVAAALLGIAYIIKKSK